MFLRQILMKALLEYRIKSAVHQNAANDKSITSEISCASVANSHSNQKNPNDETVEDEASATNSPAAAATNTMEPSEPDNGSAVSLPHSDFAVEDGNIIHTEDGTAMEELQFPVVEVEHYKTKSEYLLDKKVVQNKNSAIDFFKKYNLSLPIEDMDKFHAFDDELRKNAFLKIDVYLELTSLVDPTGCIPKSFNAILKKFIANSIALQLTAVRKAHDPTKEQSHTKFKDTELYQYMCVVMTAAMKKRNLVPSDKLMISGLSSVLCNAKRWD
ncbi:uncharacterized protein LOC103315594 [Nasonia vitripennis]|uniref:Uncharacterized protein n=1 Tax=Nasonia vitripennis TaxID=7425 RepID=A0A7M7ISA5_NASVI|nr:uncharacterized protein LOC103315594 [Nasonia vitripennis]